jgi:hypothetical protein
MKDTTLTQFVRDRNGQPRGLVVATVIDDAIRLGWSYTHIKAGDRFNKEKAYNIAFGRAENGWGDSVTMPHRVSKVFNKMLDRATRYFKNTALEA